MTIDVYQMCLGGTNKKIKFCECGKDLVGDLDKIVTAINAGQKAAALGQINRLLESHGPRACLLAMKGSSQLQMGNLEELGKVTEVFCQHYPENPIALSFAAILAATRGEVDAMIGKLQDALEATVEGTMQESTYAAIGLASRLLAQTGRVVAAIGYLQLQAAIAPEEDDTAWNLLRQIYATRSVPGPLKYVAPPLPPPQGAAWADDLEAAELPAERGCWRKAVELLKALDERHPDQPAILQRLARYQGWMNQLDDEATTLHRLAHCPALDLDYAVEAEATAQLLTAYETDMVDQILRVYPVSDTQRMLEHLMADKLVTRMPIDLTKLAREGAPPPKAAFWLLDRHTPVSGKELEMHEVPNILGEMYLYGRETDREARLEFVTVKSSDFEGKLDVLAKLVSEHCGELEKEESIGQVAAEAAAMSWKWRLPDDTPQEKREQLLQEKRRDLNLNVWPETPLSALDGKRPVDVAGDPAYLVRLLATILILEEGSERNKSDFDFNELRGKLNLPLRQVFSSAGVPIGFLSPLQLHLLDLKSLPDEQLGEAFQLAVLYSLSRAGMRLGQELLARPGLISRAERPQVYDMLIPLAADLDQMLDFIRMAYQDVVATGQSMAPWLLRELELRFMSGDAERVGELVNMLQSQHIREPGVSQALYTLLVRFGVITPDGKPNPALQRNQPQPSPLGSDQPAAAAGAQELWTPGSPQKPPGGEKPKLWMPGMD
jgi:tetratricopeptide (TPR) repeat protein